MKKILIAFSLMLAFSLNAHAQVTGPRILPNTVGNLKSTPTHPATDTITNAVVKIQYAIIGGANTHATFQPTFVKISGTVAGTAVLQGSVDGLFYSTITGQSFTMTDVATQTASFVVAPSSYQYYRLQVTPTGTQSVKLTTPVLVRKN